MKKSQFNIQKKALLIFFLNIILLFIINSCDSLNKSEENNLDKITNAINTFRSELSAVLKDVADKAQMEIDENKFVFVSPYGSFISPVALVKGLDTFQKEDISNIRKIMLTFFNLPAKSQINSGFYKVNLYQTDDTSGKTIWRFYMIDMNNRESYSGLSNFREGQYNVTGSVGNRGVNIYNNKFGVRFGFMTPKYNIENDILLGTGETVDDNSIDGQKVINSLKSLRGKVEPAMKGSSSLSLSNNMLIITRDDKTAIVARIENPKNNTDGSIELLYMYLKTPRIPAGFYKMLFKQNINRWEVRLINDKNETVWSSNYVNVGNWSGEINGVFGGIIDNYICLNLIGTIAPSNTGLMEIEINY